MNNRRVAYYQFGEPDVLKIEEIDIPAPKAREVIVRMAGAGLNPIDYKTRKGLGFVATQISDTLPWSPGYDLSGTVVAVGSEVSQWQLGDHVYGMIGFPLIGGGYGDYVSVTESELARAPSSIPLASAGGIPLAALTAWQALFVSGDLKPGSRILIHAAAGGVGHFAVQFAKARGCFVVATASEVNHAFLNQLGVDQVIDYVNQDFCEHCAPVDFVLDCIGGDVGIRSLSLLKPEAQLVTVPTITAAHIIAAAENMDVRVFGLTVKPDPEMLAHITHLVDEGDVLVYINQSFSLDNVAEAHFLLEKGHTQGKLILIP